MTSIDVTDWEPADEEPLGSKPKLWLRDPEGVLWLWKESTEQRDVRHGTFRKGDDWSEVVAGRVGERLDLPVAHVDLATRAGSHGVVSRSVVGETEVLVHGNELLAGAGLAAEDPHDRSGYTVEAVRDVLAGVGPPIAAGPPGELATAFDSFVGYLLLDAIVGNTDRHQDNWATIRADEGQRLAPSFDHASCLGFQLSDEERFERLEGQGVEQFVRRARTKFEDHPPPLDALLSALALVDDPVVEHWSVVAERLDPLDDILDQIDHTRMNAVAKRFAAAVFDGNAQALSHAVRTMRS